MGVLLPQCPEPGYPHKATPHKATGNGQLELKTIDP